MTENTFGKRLQIVVDIVGSAAALSRKTSISASLIRGYIEETNDPSRKKLIAIAEAAQVSTEWLATGKGPMRPGEKEEKCEHEPLKLHGKGRLFEKNPGFDPDIMGQIYSLLSDFKDNNPGALTKEKEIDVITVTYSLCQPDVRTEAKLICSIVMAVINGKPS